MSFVNRLTGPNTQNTIAQTLPIWLEQGITGADLSLPLFDGTSGNPLDHLIDVDTPSMETCPDVRVYFWNVGMELKVTDASVWVDEDGMPEPPTDIEERRLFDDMYVKKRREYLKGCKERGDGYWISQSRDIIAKNVPGGQYYRLPVFGILKDIYDQTIEPLEDEGYLFSGEGEWDIRGLLLTNIRVPILWAGSYLEGIVPGTSGWDQSLFDMYSSPDAPAYQVWQGHPWDQMIYYTMLKRAGDLNPTSGSIRVRSEVERIMRRNWPELKRPWGAVKVKFEGPGILELSGHTVDEFLGRTKFKEPTPN